MANVFVSSRFYEFCCSVCQWFTKLGQISGMMRYEDSSFWSRCQPLVNWMTRTMGRINWKRNISSWNLLQKRAVWYKALGYHTHLLQYCFCLILEQSNPYKKALLSMSFGKCPLNFMFLVSPNDERFYSYLGSSVGPSPMKILITSYYQNISFRNTVLSQKFEARFSLLIIFC